MPRYKSKQNLNPPKAITLSAGVTLWILGIIGYFWLSLDNRVNIWSLILAAVLLLAGSMFKSL